MSVPLRVPIDELNYMFDDESHSIMDGAMYKGKPFTGIMIDEDKRSYSETPFENGMLHGRIFEISSDGILIYEAFAEHGEVLRSTSRYWDGKLEEEYNRSPFFRKKWYDNSQIKSEQTEDCKITYRKGGTVKSEHLKNTQICTFYAQSGEWVYKVRSDNLDSFASSAENTEFNDAFINAHYLDLLEQDIDDYHFFLLWLKIKYDDHRSDTRLGEIISGMISSTNLEIKYEGLNIAELYARTDLIPLIKAQLSERNKPQGRFTDNGYKSYCWTISERAQKVLNELQGV